MESIQSTGPFILLRVKQLSFWPLVWKWQELPCKRWVRCWVLRGPPRAAGDCLTPYELQVVPLKHGGLEPPDPPEGHLQGTPREVTDTLSS